MIIFMVYGITILLMDYPLSLRLLGTLNLGSMTIGGFLSGIIFYSKINTGVDYILIMMVIGNMIFWYPIAVLIDMVIVKYCLRNQGKTTILFVAIAIGIVALLSALYDDINRPYA